MSQVAEMPKQEQGGQRLKVGEVVVKGRCVAVRKQGTVFLHLIVLPASDPYSSPSTVEVTAPQRVAQPEEDVTLLCRLGGYRRSYNKTDEDTGEIRKVQTADNRLQVLS